MFWWTIPLRISLYFATFSFPSTLTSSCLWNTAWWYLQHWDNITQMMSSSWFPPYRCLNSNNYFSHSLVVFFANSKFPSGHSDIKLRLVECCSDGCPSASFSHLHTWSLELNQWMSGSWSHLTDWLDNLLFEQFCLFPNFFHVRIMQATVLLGSRKCFVAFSRSVPRHKPVSVALTTWLGFCSGMHFQFFTIYNLQMYTFTWILFYSNNFASILTMEMYTCTLSFTSAK